MTLDQATQALELLERLGSILAIVAGAIIAHALITGWRKR